VLSEFEKGQLGLAAAPSKATTSSGEAETSRPLKRKFTFDSSTVENLALEAEEAALRQIEKEQAEALKHKLPDFWLPSLTPTYTSPGDPRSLQDVKLQTTCRGGNPKHALSMKNLIPVKFTFDGSNKDSSEQQTICPSCKKVLSNNTLIFLAKPCAHVTCKTCTDTLVRPAKQCVVCDTPLKVDGTKGDIIELRREGEFLELTAGVVDAICPPSRLIQVTVLMNDRHRDWFRWRWTCGNFESGHCIPRLNHHDGYI